MDASGEDHDPGDGVDLDSLEYVEGLTPDDWEEHREFYGAPLLTLGESVGRNARRIRVQAGRTLDDVAAEARQFGARWSTARVVELEKGTRTLTVANLLLIQLVLGNITQRPVTLSELVSGRCDIEVTPRLLLDAAKVSRAFAGATSAEVFERPTLVMSADEVRGDVLERVRKTLPDATQEEAAVAAVAVDDLAEQRAAKSLFIDPVTLRVLAERRWGHSLAQERNARSRGDSPQARGRATRELLGELSQALAEARGADRGNG